MTATIERPDKTTATASVIDTVRTVAALRGHVTGWRRSGLRVALVPTMGALHDGHLSLVRAALAAADRVVVSLFVNPTQFGPNEDFASYPAREAEDARLLTEVGAHVLFAPTVAEMYPDGFATTVTVAGLTKVLCGASRPGHFAGVTTVVAKLFSQCQPDLAFFGEKDYQQLLVIRRMAHDLDLPVEIRGVPIVREGDGLALSSRNAYLSGEERRIALVLNRTITAVARQVANGGADCAAACDEARAALLAAGFASVDYVEVRDAETLAPLSRVAGPARVFVAARLGKARLIDNVAV